MTDKTPKPMQGLGDMAAAFTASAQQLSESLGMTEPKRVERKGLVLALAIIPAVIAGGGLAIAAQDSVLALYVLVAFVAVAFAKNNVSLIRGLAKDWAPAGRFFTREAQKEAK